MPQTRIGKLFLMIYSGFGIPLTFIFIIHLSYLIRPLIEYISLIIFYFYSSNSFQRIGQCLFIRSIEKQLNFLLEDEEKEDFNSLNTSSKIQQYVYNFFNIFKNYNEDDSLPIKKLIFTFFIYILIGTYFIKSKSFLDSFYSCFTTILTINFTMKNNQESNSFLIITYFFFGLAILLLCIKAIKIRLETLLIYMEQSLIRNLLEFSQHIGTNYTGCFDEKFSNFHSNRLS